MLALAAMTSGQGWRLPGAWTPLGVIVAPTVATALSVRSPNGPAATKAHGMTGLLTTLLPVHGGCVCQCCAMVVLDAQVKDQRAKGCLCGCHGRSCCRFATLK